MIGLLLFLQVALLVGWYALPAMAAVPTAIIFMPTIITLLMFAFFIVVAAAVHR